MENGNVMISVIMPVYNAADFLNISINSVLSQTFSEFEFIIIDDCSTDSSLEIIKSFHKKYPNVIKVIALDKNLRQGGARNKGLEHAKGKYIYFIDSDDWIDRYALERLYLRAEKNESDFTGTNYYYRVTVNGTVYTERSFGKKNNWLVETVYSGKILNKEERNRLLFSVGGVCNNLFRASIINTNNIRFPEGLSYEDNYFVSLYLTYVNRISYDNMPFYYYRENEKSTVFRKDNTQLQRIEVEKMLYDELIKRNKYDFFKEGYEILALRRWFLNSIPIVINCSGSKALEELKLFRNTFFTKFRGLNKNRYYKEEFKLRDLIKIKMVKIAPRLLIALYRCKQK